MSNVIQYLLAGTIVLAATFYAVWNLVGASVRHRWTSGALAHFPGEGWTHRFLQRQVARQSARLTGGGCGSCGSNADRKPPQL